MVVVDVGSDGTANFVFMADLAAAVKQPIYCRLAHAEVHYLLGEARLQVSAANEGTLVVVGPHKQLLAEPGAALQHTPALWFETKGISFYPLEGDELSSLEAAIDLFRNTKAEARAAREARSQARPPAIPHLISLEDEQIKTSGETSQSVLQSIAA